MTHPWSEQPNDPLIVPNTAGPNDSAIIITGDDIPPCMRPAYTSAIFWRPKDSATGTVLTDAPLFFIAIQDTGGSITSYVDFGAVLYDPIAGYCDYAVYEQRKLDNSGGVLSFEHILGTNVVGVTTTRDRAQNVIRTVQDFQQFITDVGGSIQHTGYIPYTSAYQSQNGGGVNSPLTPAFAVIPNTLVTFDVFRTTDVVDVWGTFDMMQAIAGANVGIGLLLVDGVPQAQQANYRPGALGSRAPCTRFWSITGLATGTHTFGLAISATLLNSFTVNPVHTSIMVNPRY